MYRCLIRRTLVTGHERRKAKVVLKDNVKAKNVTSKKLGDYSETILLPRTEFRAQLNGKERIEKDAELTAKRGFTELYKWQRKNLPGPEFVLHDGPPYANGVPHMGHAINKILKDITLRHKILRKNRVHYVPGWDCHGLPVELKAIQDVAHDPLEIRKKARLYAEQAAIEQRRAFQSWGVTADWSDSGCYFTNSSLYMKKQLRQFLEMYEKGFVFRDFMPVYWSPSTRTALAESELEYNRNHRSKAVTLRLRIHNVPRMPDIAKGDRVVYGLIWTTTPWSLVANQAVAFAAEATYCIAEDTKGILYVLAKDSVEAVQLKIGHLRPLQYFKGEDLNGSIYYHPLNGKKCPFLAGRHVTTNVGTGLVHTAPAHGAEDFLVALENDIRILSVVDSDGRYTADAGSEFHGSEVLTEGVDKVLTAIGPDVLHVETLTHSYPYDWRTKQPVLIRASNQWFIDINSVREKVMDRIVDVKIYPACNRTSFTNALLAGIKNRPYWCISRQRSWGTPIPVLYNKNTGEPFTDKLLVDRLCHSIDRHGPDCWWEHSVDELFGVDAIERMNVAANQVEKGMDIMDIWFDSGISWSTVLPGGKADLYLEGHDQFGGWFQSSLITSVALQDRPPYSSLFVHGFAVDEDCVKMSKSVGNVISPDELLLGGSNLEKKPVYGVDVLRWWVASHGSQHTQIPVSKDLLEGCKQSVYKIRLILRFLLGVLYPYHDGTGRAPEYRAIDKYMLHLLYRYNEQMQRHYESYEYHHAGKTIMRFIANDVSAFYCTLIKDRLYCEPTTSATRAAAVHVIEHVFNVLARSLAPILPHLAEEAWQYCPGNEASVPLHYTGYELSESWNDTRLAECVNVALKLRDTVLQKADKNTWKLKGVIEATEEDFSSLSPLHAEGDPSTSELCEILQLSSVSLMKNREAEETKIALDASEKLCLRCRRYPGSKGGEGGLCVRCIDVLGVNGRKVAAVGKAEQ